MTLDPSHFQEIKQLTRKIPSTNPVKTYTEIAMDLWTNHIPNLETEDEPLLEPIDHQFTESKTMKNLTRNPDKSMKQTAIDAGSLTPRLFRNGMTLDLAQAAMASIPTDLDLHRKRTTVTAVHTKDEDVIIDEEETNNDEGFHGKILQVDTDAINDEREAVRSYSLYTAETLHLLSNIDEIGDTLALDGPIYPVSLLRWGDAQKSRIHESNLAIKTLNRYIEIADEVMERNSVYYGFVKNPTSSMIVNSLSTRGHNCPWSKDTSLIREVLANVTDKHEIGYTNWFISRFHTDEGSSIHPMAYKEKPGHPEADQYLVTQMYIYDPRKEVVFRVEAPFGITQNSKSRESITETVLGEVALNGVPRVIDKADEIARISRGEKSSVLMVLEEMLGVDTESTYNEQRWGS